MSSTTHGLVAAFRVFGPVDVKNIRREGLLVWLTLAMAGIAMLFRFGVPELAAVLDSRLGFDLIPYYDLVMSAYVGTAAGIAGMVIGFLLLDERDEHTLTALLVTPLPIGVYLAYRITLPLVVGFVVTCVTYPLVGLAPISVPDLIVVAGLASFGGPLAAMFLAVFAENKITGLALTKVLNTIGMIPVLAYFVRSDWQLLAGIVPAYWPMKMVWLAVAGEPYAWYAAVGLVVNLAFLWLLLRRFNTVLHR
jgi:fluoroquinolone transport system permease protein